MMCPFIYLFVVPIWPPLTFIVWTTTIQIFFKISSFVFRMALG